MLIALYVPEVPFCALLEDSGPGFLSARYVPSPIGTSMTRQWRSGTLRLVISGYLTVISAITRITIPSRHLDGRAAGGRAALAVL